MYPRDHERHPAWNNDPCRDFSASRRRGLVLAPFLYLFLYHGLVDGMKCRHRDSRSVYLTIDLDGGSGHGFDRGGVSGNIKKVNVNL